MKHLAILFSFCFLLCLNTIEAQAQPGWQWAKSVGGSGDDAPLDIEVDKSGNTYVIGQFRSSSITFGDTTLTNVNPGFYDMFFVKYDRDGNVVWARGAGGSLDDQGYYIANDTNGNSYVTGFFRSSSITFEGYTLTNASTGFYDLFVVKYNKDGVVVWAKREGSADNDQGRGIAADDSGNCFVAGEFSGSSITLGDTTLTNNGGADIFIVKYDTNGNIRWARSAGGGYHDEPYDMSGDGHGNSYMTGQYSSLTIVFGNDTLTNIGPNDNGNVFVVKYNGDGGVIWAKSVGGTSDDRGTKIATDRNGNSVVTGYFLSSSITFGNTTLTNSGNKDLFVAKYDASGAVSWAKGAGGNNDDVGWGAAIDDSGNSYITGFFFSPSIAFGTYTLTNVSTSYNDVLIAKYDGEGNVQWATRAGGALSDYGYGIGVDGDKNIHVTGLYNSSTISFGSDTLVNAQEGSFDMFVAKTGLIAATISGTKFNDLNGNGARDFNDTGLVNWKIMLSGAKVDSVLTDTNGKYMFGNLPAGQYTLSEVNQNGWTQTFPSSGSYTISLSSGDSVTGKDFGNRVDSIFNRTYRSFTKQDLEAREQKKAVRKKPKYIRICASFVNTTGVPVNGLSIKYTKSRILPVILDFESIAPFTSKSTTDEGRSWHFGGATIDTGQTVTICAIGNTSRRMKIEKWCWLINNNCFPREQPGFSPIDQTPLLPMPNLANLRDEVFAQGGFPVGMVCGIAMPESAKRYGWVRIARSSTFSVSLNDRGLTHTAPCREFDRLDNGRAFIGEQKGLSPRKQNNRLFANLVSLKLGITASKMGKTPVGFGDLLYCDDAGNPLTGLTISQIADRTDSALTFWRDASSHGWHCANFDTTIAKINASFDGPIDTVSFAIKLILKGVRPLKDVRFLCPNPNAVPPEVIPLRDYTESEVPAQFMLYQNYPNPFNPTTTIQFALPQEAFVTLKVYNVLGQEVVTLLDHEILEEGSQEAIFDASTLPSGVYFYRLIAEGIAGDEVETSAQTFTGVRKMLLIR